MKTGAEKGLLKDSAQENKNMSMVTSQEITTIKPYEKNAKKHPKKQIKQVADSIKEFGFNQPIVVDKNNVVIVGHGRLEAAKLLNLKEVPVLRVDLTDVQAKAYRLADNKLNESEWETNLVIDELKELNLQGFDIELTGFDKDLIIEPEDRDDEVPELPEEPKSKLGDIYQLGEHRLMCGSATEERDIMALMNGELAEMVWTDHPYNVDYEGGTGLKIQNDSMSNDQFYQFLFDFYYQTRQIMHNGCPIYVAHADSEAVNFRKALEDAGIELRQCIIWVKNSFVLCRQDYQWQHEPILYGWKSGAAHRWYGMFDKATVIDDEIDIKKLKKEDLQELVQSLRNERKTTVIREKKPARSAEHPTMKPVSLIVKFLMNSSRQGDVVYDGFGGSGSTLIAAEKLNRKCYMMELDPKYVDVIVKRWENYTGQIAEKI